MKKSSPIMFDNEQQTLTEAGLFIHPITYDDFGRQPDEEDFHLDEPIEEVSFDVNNNFATDQASCETSETIESQTAIEDAVTLKSNDDVAIKSVVPEESLEEEITEFDAEIQRKIEEMIESVMSSAREEVDWLKMSNENLESSPPVIESCIAVRKIPEDPPLPPRRKKSNIEENVTVKTFGNIESNPLVEDRLPIIDESEIISTNRDITLVEPENKKTEIGPIEDNSIQEDDILEPELMQDYGVDTEQRQDDISFTSQLPSRLHLSSLEIDNLNVCSLSAGRITSSEIDTNTLVTNELEVKSSHNLANPMSIEFPPGFIEEIVERVRSVERAEQQTAALAGMLASAVEKDGTQAANESEQPPARPPLPAQFSFSSVPASFYHLKDYSEDEKLQPQMPQRRRRHQNKRKDSTSEEEYQREQRARNRGALSGDQSVLALGGQFVRACGNALRETGGQIMDTLRASSKDENKRDLHIAIIILIIIVAGLVLMSMGDKSVHHHHWDFFNPPDSHGR